MNVAAKPHWYHTLQELTKPGTPTGPAAAKAGTNDGPQVAPQLAQLEAQLLAQLQQTLASGLTNSGGSGRLCHDRLGGAPHSAPCSRHASPLKQRHSDRLRHEDEEEVRCNTRLPDSSSRV